ncbi:hypothetical protein HaLaN_03168 [Haematococcus lacustris]|uniref:Uncharacterized protein n=1 Tax=Haematococcus lacustris TaxID=44745 RepID=A0A699YDR4_HAELA|nr:hypothetical protein HaLaN_03168 [Haematococcus lacustris]
MDLATAEKLIFIQTNDEVAANYDNIDKSNRQDPVTVCSGAKPDSLTSRNLFEKAKANVLPGGRDVPDTAWRRLLVAVQQARSCQELYRLYRTNGVT